MPDLPQQPLLPAQPWYTSPVQRAQVFGAVSSLAALIIQLFEIHADIAVVNLKIGLVAQCCNLAFGVWGIIKRQTSTVHPLTMTEGGAKAATAKNPPMLDADPTKTAAPQQTATMSNTPPKDPLP